MPRKKRNNTEKRPVRVYVPIVAKLCVIFALILFTVLVIVNYLNSEMASQDLLAATEEDNYTINTRSALEAENRLNSVRNDVYYLLDIVRIAGKNSPFAKDAVVHFFERSGFIAAIFVPEYIDFVNEQFFIFKNINSGSVRSWVSHETARIERARQGEPIFVNVSVDIGTSLVAMFYPWQQNDQAETVVIFFSLDELAEQFGARYHSSFMVNPVGDVLVHTDYRMMRYNSNISKHPLFNALKRTDARDISLIYTDKSESGSELKFFGAGEKLSFGGLMVFTSIEYDLPFERTTATVRRNIYLIISAVFGAVVLIWLLSKTVTDPVHRLWETITQVEAGKYDISLKYRFPDEIGVLSYRFVQMGATLKKREQFLDAFGQYTSPETIEKLKESKVEFRGEKKQASVLYVSINFNSGELLKQKPHHVITVLSNYLTKIREIVEKYGGIVNNFQNNRLTAVWGAPIPGESIEANAFSCVKAAVKIRSVIMDLNSHWRVGQYIACFGIDTGEIFGGQIGVSSRKEYSVLGIPVFMAAWIEAYNKKFGTDILITEKTWELIGDKFITQKMPSVTIKEVKGSRKLYAIINIKAVNPEEQKQPGNLDELQEFIGIPHPEKKQPVEIKTPEINVEQE